MNIKELNEHIDRLESEIKVDKKSLENKKRLLQIAKEELKSKGFKK